MVHVSILSAASIPLLYSIVIAEVLYSSHPFDSQILFERRAQTKIPSMHIEFPVVTAVKPQGSGYQETWVLAVTLEDT